MVLQLDKLHLQVALIVVQETIQQLMGLVLVPFVLQVFIIIVVVVDDVFIIVILLF